MRFKRQAAKRSKEAENHGPGFGAKMEAMADHLFGAHMPAAGGPGGCVRAGHEIGCTAIQVFTASPRMWKKFPVDPAKAADLAKAKTETGIHHVAAHDSYLINLADPRPEGRERSIQGLIGELERCAAYGIPHVVSHIGAHMGAGAEAGLALAAKGIQEVLAGAPPEVTLLMETTAGQGTCLNHRMEELETLFQLTGRPPRLGVCVDTCHIFAAGYDIRTEAGYRGFWKEFEERIGMNALHLIHCNDSKKPLASRVDRHENLGEGEIGETAFRLLTTDPRFFQVPIIVETPIENDGHKKNVAKLWKWSESS